MEKLAKFLEEYPNSRILDIGTGTGVFINIISQLSNSFAEIVGIDISKKAIEVAKEQFKDPRITFLEMDVLDMPFEDNSFDLVCLSNSLHHLSDPHETIAAMERVLKKGGALVFNEMMCDCLDDKQISHRMIHHFAAEIDRELGIPHNDTFRRSEILDFLSKQSSLKISESWDLKFDRRTKNTKEEIDWLHSTLDKMLVRVKDHNSYSIFEEKAADIRNYIDKHGFDSATQLLVVMKDEIT